MTDLVFLGINDLGERVYDFLVDRDDVQVLALLTERDQLDVVERLPLEQLCWNPLHALRFHIVDDFYRFCRERRREPSSTYEK